MSDFLKVVFVEEKLTPDGEVKISHAFGDLPGFSVKCIYIRSRREVTVLQSQSDFLVPTIGPYRLVEYKAQCAICGYYRTNFFTYRINGHQYVVAKNNNDTIIDIVMNIFLC